MAMPEAHDHSGELFEELPDLSLPEGVEAAEDDEPGGPYLRRSGEVLIASGDLEEASERLVDQEHSIVEPEVGDLPIAVAHVEDVRAAMDQIHRVDARQLDAAPNHVFHPAPGFRWRTFEPPRPAEPRPEAEPSGGASARVAVLDTGAADHPWFGGRVEIGHGDVEAPDEDGDGKLDANRGHGTFVTGVVLAHAPGATVRAVRVPEIHGAGSPGGLVDDLALARTLVELEEFDVVNLSLGGATRGDAAPPAFAAALALLQERQPDTVIVAAAGNDGSRRPNWPAAFKGVVAVGALDRAGDPASFSNRGWWVDAWAPGVDVHSTFLDWNGPVDHPSAAGDEQFDGWALWCGTSFAAPRVSGTIAAAVSSAGTARRGAFKLLSRGTNRPRLHGRVLGVSEPS